MNKKRPELAHFRKTFYEIVPRSRKIKTNFRYINEQRGAGVGGAHNLSPSGSDPPNPTLLIFGPSATLHSANKRRSHTFRSMGSHFRSLLPFSLSIRSTFSLSLTLHLSLSLCCKRLPDLSHALQLSLSLTFSFSPTFLFRKIHLPTTTSFGECDS